MGRERGGSVLKLPACGAHPFYFYFFYNNKIIPFFSVGDGDRDRNGCALRNASRRSPWQSQIQPLDGQPMLCPLSVSHLGYKSSTVEICAFATIVQRLLMLFWITLAPSHIMTWQDQVHS